MPIKTKRTKPRRKILLTLFNIFIITLILSVVLTAGVIFTIVRGAIAKMPDMDLSKIELDESPKIYDSKGGLLAQDLTEQFRRSVPYSDISKDMVNAIVAIEDKTFWEHEGFNYVRLLGAIKESLSSSGGPSATSTITQQLARNAFLSSDRSIIRKIQEAYIATKLEDLFTKEEIMTHYLNTIAFGSNSEGIEAASEKYFSKKAKDLDYIESAMLASVPQAPTRLAPMLTLYRNDWDGVAPIVGQKGADMIYVYNKSIEERYTLVLKLMQEQGYISQEQYDAGVATDLATKIKVGMEENTEFTSYFTDIISRDVIADLQKAYQIPYEDAAKRFYTQGMNVDSTLDPDMQKAVENVMRESGDATLYSDIVADQVYRYQAAYGLEATGVMNDQTWTKMIEQGYFTEAMLGTVWNIGDRDGRVSRLKEALTTEGIISQYDPIPSVSPDFENGVMLSEREHGFQFAASNYLDYFDKAGNATIPTWAYTVDEAGNVSIPRGNIIKFGETENGIWADFQPMYDFNGNVPNNGYYGKVELRYFLLYRDHIITLPKEHMEIVNDQLVFKAEMLTDPSGAHLTEAGLVIPESYIARPNSPVIQPQVAAAVIEPSTGYLKAIIGGRGVVGNQLYNRATSPQQPGSSIKPISVYGPAIESRRFTAATVIDDTPTFRYLPGERYWPQNAYDAYPGFYGRMSAREALNQSTNVVAVKLGEKVGFNYMAEMLQKNGITSLVTEGETNDMNLAALTLGGMSRGISPVEMASAYGTFANQGVHIPWKTYTRVTDASGNVILDNTAPTGDQVYSPEASWIMLDMLTDNVDRGLGADGRIRGDNRGIPVAGKTGTTSSHFDLTFAGTTPYYAAAVWLGSDVYVPLNGFSDKPAFIFRDIMTALHANLEDRTFFEKPASVVQVQVDSVSGLLPGPLSALDPRGGQFRYEWFIDGTVPTTVDDAHVSMEVCEESGKLVAEYCEHTTKKVFITRVDPDDNMRGLGYRVVDQKFTVPKETCPLHTEPPKPETKTEPTKPQTPTEPVKPVEPVDPPETP